MTSSVPVPRPSEPVTVLPDGSAFFVGTLPLPSDHWLYAPEYQPPPMGLRMSVSNPQRIEMVRYVTDAVRWAVRGATMKGTVADFDPDALVQNAVVGLLGYFAKDALSTDAWANPSPVPDETFVVRSPSVPTATQEQRDADWTISDGRIYAKCAYCGGDNGRNHSGRVFPWACGHCGKEIILAEPAGTSSEEAANSDTERLDWLSQFASVSAYDAQGRMLFSNHWYEAGSERQATIREAIDTAKSAARVQGEDSQ